jgi:hypothetical protein
MKSFLFLSIVFVGCAQPRSVEDPLVWKKVKMDFRRFDNEGLAGPADGKVAANYEFCIPATEKYWLQVKKVDITAQRSGGKGRIACSDKEWMIIGSTHQKNFQRVLFELASLTFVREIQETFYE